MMTYNSSGLVRTQNLAPLSVEKARKILYELVNIRDADPDDLAAVKRFMELFGDIFTPEIPEEVVQRWAARVEEENVSKLSKDKRDWEYWLKPLRNAVRKLWVADTRTKRWGMFQILCKYFRKWDRGLTADPVLDELEWSAGSLGPPTPCEQLIQQLRGRTCRCRNYDCSAPYFWAKRSSQKFCSEECAGPFQRQSKRTWWAKHGKEWRRSRVAKGKKEKKRKK